MDYNKEYVEKNLIAYIGNKRRLLPLLIDGLKAAGFGGNNKGKKFLDLFAGTGVVSRLAKSLGFDVYTNDWEYYSYVMNKSFIESDTNFLKNGFKKLGGIDAAILELNSIETVAKDDRYISEFYCPADDTCLDLDNERMFYTRYNGLKIDGIRAKIEEWFESDLIDNKEKDFLISLLLYEASTRSNTSGVFKAFHRGFGGTNGDALSRIMKKIELVKPELCDGKGFVFNDDAITLAEKLKDTVFDIVYLDPPYNQHQYGSNYHMLNTIALNDKPEVNKNVIINGKKINKSAIRKDWIKTRSGFCYKDSAADDFKVLINNINAKMIMISYSTDGIIPFDKILDILAEKGKLSIVTSEYEKYRGGKQALTSELKNVEFIILVDTTAKRKSMDVSDVKKYLSINKIEVNLKKTISTELLSDAGYSNHSADNVYTKEYGKKTMRLEVINSEIYDSARVLNFLSDMNVDQVDDFLSDLEYVTSITREDEIYICLNHIKKSYECGNYDLIDDVFEKIPYFLSKFNNRKAFVPSLKAIDAVLSMMNDTRDYWQNRDILNCKSFNKIEGIILKKLNNGVWENDAEAVLLKRNIGMKYDELYEYCSTPSAKNVMENLTVLSSF